MIDERDLADRLRRDLGAVDVPEGDLSEITRRAKGRRLRRRSTMALASILAFAAVAVPLVLLYGLRGASHPVGTSPTPSASPPPPGWVQHTDPAGVSIDTPAAWNFNDDPVPALLGPPTLFAVGTGPLPSGGDCAPTPALDALPSDGMLFAVTEYDSVGQAGTFPPYMFPPRPATFDLGPVGGPFECWGVSGHVILFQDGGRYFQVFVIFGPDAPDALRAETIQSLDTLSVLPLSPAQLLPTARRRAGQWTNCPEAAWVYAVIQRAGIVELGSRGSDAIIGMWDGRTFALWTKQGRGAGGSCRGVAGLKVCQSGVASQIFVPVNGLQLWIEAASSTLVSPRAHAALPDDPTLTRLILAAQSIPLTEFKRGG